MSTEIPDNVRQVVIPRDKAVFWMDSRGRWHNQHGPFQHKKIIDHFNAAIGKDEGGYFVGQLNDGLFEKVYFPHEVTALFAVDLLWNDPVRMVLNTGAEIDLDPQCLFIRNDHLFHRHGDEIVKFSERVLARISEKIDHDGQGYVLEWMGNTFSLPEC